MKDPVKQFKEAEVKLALARLDKARAIRGMILNGMSYSEMAIATGSKTRQSLAQFYKQYKDKIV